MEFPLTLAQASTFARRVDLIFGTLMGIDILLTLLVAVLALYWSIKYRQGSQADRSNPPEGNTRVEVSWVVALGFFFLAMFIWAGWTYFEMATPPARAIQMYGIGRQWMWKFQHPDGQREINELHVPIGQPVKLLLTSQDVIHSFYVPAFRVKQDVLPGRYTMTWFEATQTGEYHLFCTEYCGTMHSGMIGRVVVMDPAEYEQWLKGGPTAAERRPGQPMAAAGQQLFQSLGCSGCHRPDGTGVAPSLVGLFGKPVALQTGQIVTADEQYLRDSILLPARQMVAGYPPVMPAFQGRVSEEQLLQLLEYLKSLG
ncbi:MAG: cytochrome c oxidase subunit II [Candidatus Tectomicrobia bacterium]|uniref:cytochrome-c oxidase n=1 Tax=Tectimicrobiota bacterium TaxID=2528274 RepID=A0A932FWQ8_UNCTE|nr:cytochrome c oxidase subunit II [Candidatus Tectomicrobia bacterium]